MNSHHLPSGTLNHSRPELTIITDSGLGQLGVQLFKLYSVTQLLHFIATLNNYRMPHHLFTPPSQLFVPGMPTCLLCTCIGGSVYCDDLKLDSVPPLPKDTSHFYARFNRITKINKSDFASMSMFLAGWLQFKGHYNTTILRF